jgi:hypothetical protein
MAVNKPKGHTTGTPISDHHGIGDVRLLLENCAGELSYMLRANPQFGTLAHRRAVERAYETSLEKTLNANCRDSQVWQALRAVAHAAYEISFKLEQETRSKKPSLSNDLPSENPSSG